MQRIPRHRALGDRGPLACAGPSRALVTTGRVPSCAKPRATCPGCSGGLRPPACAVARPAAPVRAAALFAAATTAPCGAPAAPARAAPRRPAAAPPRPPRRPRASILARFSAAVPAPVAAPGPGGSGGAGAAEIALPLPRAVESAADDPLLHNPLERMERLGTGWFGVIAEYEGVVVDSTLEAHKEAWRRVAAEMGLPPPLGSALGRIKGVRDEVAIMQLFTWTRNPAAAAGIAARKEALYDEIMSGNHPAEMPGVRAFLETLHNYKIPVALASPLPERRVRPALERLSLDRAFDAVVTAEDSGAPEVEAFYLAAAHQLRRPPLRVAVVGDGNRSVEAAHELGMKSVIVTGGQPAWNFGAADLVVRSLGQLSLVNLKQLFAQEDLVEPSTPWEEILEQRKADEEAAMAGGGGGGWSTVGMDGGGGGGGWGRPEVWEPLREAEAGGARGGRGRGGAVPVPVPAAARAPSSAASDLERQLRGDLSGSYEDDLDLGIGEDDDLGDLRDLSDLGGKDELEVIMPPKGAAFWDMQR
ncbi:MAG: HAD-like domain-containing protein [Monoraphidium minutum]|nr:MAG: HAD-like domain-containing protein [Monoraphidium minutum]